MTLVLLVGVAIPLEGAILVAPVRVQGGFREALLELGHDLSAEALGVRLAKVKAVLRVGVHAEVIVVDKVLVALNGLEAGLLPRARVLRGTLDVLDLVRHVRKEWKCGGQGK